MRTMFAFLTAASLMSRVNVLPDSWMSFQCSWFQKLFMRKGLGSNGMAVYRVLCINY